MPLAEEPDETPEVADVLSEAASGAVDWVTVAVPVNNGVSNIQQSSLYNSSSLTSTPTLTSLPSNGTIAPWTGSGTPTRSQCYSQVLSQGVGQVSVSDGTLLCVITPQDRVALLKVVDDQADNDEGILTDAVVWSQISSATTPAD